MDSLPTPIEIIEKQIAELKNLELEEVDRERLTQIASQLSDLKREVQSRLDKKKS